jgi:hypothetical protein
MEIYWRKSEKKNYNNNYVILCEQIFLNIFECVNQTKCPENFNGLPVWHYRK